MRLKAKRVRVLFAFFLLLSLLSGCFSACGETAQTPSGGKTVQMDTVNRTLKKCKADGFYGTTYEICPYAFADTNGDGIGDLKGIEKKLDYLNDGKKESEQSLGVDGIWLTPVSKAYSYHKYDVVDYKSIDPDFGSMEDYEDLIQKCHKRGMKVYYDLVINHTSDHHPWFLSAAQYLKSLGDQNPDPSQCPYFDYYHFSREQKDGYVKLAGSQWYYEARFWSGMPDLNLDSQAVRSEIKDIMKFWLDRKVDGFRLDAVTSYYTGDEKANIAFLKWLKDTAEGIRKNVYLVGEAWTNQLEYASYYQSGVDSFFDFAFADDSGVITGTSRGSYNALQFAKALVKEEDLYAKNNPNAINAPFYTNHDMARSAGYYAGMKEAKAKTKVAGALNLMTRGNAFVYYGEELGMKGSGKDEDKRQPMLWTGKKDGRYMCDPPVGSDEVKMIYPAYDKQKSDPLSIYNYYRNAIRIRSAFPEIAEGKTRVDEKRSTKNTAVMVKEWKGKKVMLVLNLSKKTEKVDLSGSGFDKLAAVLNVSTAEVKYEKKTLTIPSYDIAVLTEQ